MSRQVVSKLLLIFLVIFSPVLKIEAGLSIQGKFKPCDEVLGKIPDMGGSLPSSPLEKMMSYKEAMEYIKGKKFQEIAEFWAWTRSDKRPSNFPRDPDSYYSEWDSRGGILSFLKIDANSMPYETVEYFMEQLSDKLGGMEEAMEHIIQLFAKYKVNLSNSPSKRKQYEELGSIPSFPMFKKHYPHIADEVRLRIGQRPWRSFSEFMKKLEEAHGGRVGARSYIIRLFVEHDIISRKMFFQKQKTLPELTDFPIFDSFLTHIPEVINEVLIRQHKNKQKEVKEYMKKLAKKKGSMEKARAHIIELFVKLGVRDNNFLLKQELHQELTEVPQFASFYHYDETLTRAVLNRQGKAQPVNINEFFEKLSKEHGGIEQAEEHVIGLFVEHGISVANFSEKRELIPEFNEFPSYSGLRKAKPELIALSLERIADIRPTRVKAFMRSLSKKKGGMEEAKKYIIELFVKHRVNKSNFTALRSWISELKNIPHYASLQNAYPEMIREIKQKIKEAQSLERQLKKLAD